VKHFLLFVEKMEKHSSHFDSMYNPTSQTYSIYFACYFFRKKWM